LNENILNTGVQLFIENNLNADILSVLLSGPIFKGISQKEIAQQIEGKKKAQTKLPSWYNTPGVYYPKKVNLEQTSSEITAIYKAGLVTGKYLADLTGGFGVDAYFFSHSMEKVVHCEWDQELHAIVNHNAKAMGAGKIEFICGDGIEFLKKNTMPLDWVYLDPSRRDDSSKKVFQLSDCMPDVSLHQELILEHSKAAMIKTSPLLDITAGLAQLQKVHEVHVVAVNNEVKELLWLLRQEEPPRDVLIKTVNLRKKTTEVFEFYSLDEKKAISSYAPPAFYLYEPNSAILKSGGFKILGVQLGLNKLHEHSHLYTSESLLEFPGRAFKIEQVMSFNKKSMRSLKNIRANVTTRNFPETVASLRSQFRIKDGGDIYLFFTTNNVGERIVVQCIKPRDV
jgi:16S rRNA G966 N2-methylase RsmD